MAPAPVALRGHRTAGHSHVRRPDRYKSSPRRTSSTSATSSREGAARRVVCAAFGSAVLARLLGNFRLYQAALNRAAFTPPANLVVERVAVQIPLPVLYKLDEALPPPEPAPAAGVAAPADAQPPAQTPADAAPVPAPTRTGSASSRKDAAPASAPLEAAAASTPVRPA